MRVNLNGKLKMTGLYCRLETYKSSILTDTIVYQIVFVRHGKVIDVIASSDLNLLWAMANQKGYVFNR